MFCHMFCQYISSLFYFLAINKIDLSTVNNFQILFVHIAKFETSKMLPGNITYSLVLTSTYGMIGQVLSENIHLG